MGSRAAPLCENRAARDHAEARDETHGSFRAKSKEVEMPTGGVRTGRRKDDNTRRFPRPIDAKPTTYLGIYTNRVEWREAKNPGRGLDSLSLRESVGVRGRLAVERVSAPGSPLILTFSRTGVLPEGEGTRVPEGEGLQRC